MTESGLTREETKRRVCVTVREFAWLVKISFPIEPDRYVCLLLTLLASDKFVVVPPSTGVRRA